MLSINTNLSSLIAQNSMKTSTNKLNQAIERMTTGAKINHAKDNAANYSISTNMTTRMNAYMVAEDNVAMGMDMVATISENLELIDDHVKRIRDLCEQASNGTYGEESLKAIQSEIDARLAEVERLKSSAEFNGIKLLESSAQAPAMYVTGSFIEEVNQLTEDEAIAQGYTIIKTADELQAMKDNLSGKYILMNDIDLEGYNWTPVGSDYSNSFSGELNGNGFVIKNLTINKPEDNVGLFGFISGATIKNLGIINAEVTGYENVSILAGWVDGSVVSINNCYTKGYVSGWESVGGIVGYTGSLCTLTLKNSWVDANVYASDKSVGGLVGYLSYNHNLISNCYTLGEIGGKPSIGPARSVGGLVGTNSGNFSVIKNSYSCMLIDPLNNIFGAIIGEGDLASTSENIYYDSLKCASAGTSYATAKTSDELQALIDNGTLPVAKTPVLPTPPAVSGGSQAISFQVGINSGSNSQINFNLPATLDSLNIAITDSDSARASLTTLDNYLAKISDYQTEYGALTNRLESVLDEITIQYDNLVSSRSTIRDADIAEVSSQYIQQQILQQASATLMATANQSPSIALQLI